MTFTAIEPSDFPWFRYSDYSFSLGLDLGARVTLSGHSASEFDPDTKKMVIRGGMEEQSRTAYAKIGRILEAAGLAFDDAVRVVENVTIEGIDHYADAERIRSEVFGDATPAVDTVVVHRLLRPAALVEIEVIASRDGEALLSDSSGRPARSPAVRDGRTVYLSTIHPYDEGGRLVGKGDVVAQARQIFENASRVLSGCGLTMANVVKTIEMIRPEALEDYRYTGRVRGEFLGPVYPAATGILQDRVAADDGVLLSYDFVATLDEPRAVNPGWDRYEKLTYSPAVAAGDTLFMSGQAALDPETERALFPTDVVAQTRYIYENVIAVLDAAGLGPEHLVKTIEYLPPEGLTDYRGTADVRKDLLHEPYPASTGALCHSLLRPEFLIEVDPTAIFPTD